MKAPDASILAPLLYGSTTVSAHYSPLALRQPSAGHHNVVIGKFALKSKLSKLMVANLGVPARQEHTTSWYQY